MSDLIYSSSSHRIKYQKFTERLFSSNPSSEAKYNSQTIQKPLKAVVIDYLIFRSYSLKGFFFCK